jgi:hypothetical protein
MHVGWCAGALVGLQVSRVLAQRKGSSNNGKQYKGQDMVRQRGCLCAAALGGTKCACVSGACVWCVTAVLTLGTLRRAVLCWLCCVAPCSGGTPTGQMRRQAMAATGTAAAGPRAGVASP